MKKIILSIIVLTGALLFPANNLKADESKNAAAYLFSYFTGQNDGLKLAYSYDGLTWTDLNGGKPVISGDTIAQQKGIRDPHITRGKDGAFYLAMTDLHIYGKEVGYRTTNG